MDSCCRDSVLQSSQYVLGEKVMSQQKRIGTKQEIVKLYAHGNSHEIEELVLDFLHDKKASDVLYLEVYPNEGE
jgi:hypothetical protein